MQELAMCLLILWFPRMPLLTHDPGTSQLPAAHEGTRASEEACQALCTLLFGTFWLEPFLHEEKGCCPEAGQIMVPGGKWGHSHSPAVLLTLWLPL